MVKTRRGGSLLGVRPASVLLGIAILPAGSRAGEHPHLFRPPDRAALSALATLPARRGGSAPTEVRWSPETGRLRSLGGSFLLPAAAGDTASACLEFLSAEAALFGWRPNLELRLESLREGLGSAHLRFRAFRNGLPLAGAEVSFHVDEERAAIVRITSRLPAYFAPGEEIEAGPPAVSEARAAGIAEASLGEALELLEPTASSLEIDPVPAPGRLVHRVVVRPRSPRGRFVVRVDASTGEIISGGNLLRFAPVEKRDGSGDVFIASPVVTLNDPGLEDRDDAADAVPSEAYTRVVLRDLDGSGALTGPYADTRGTPGGVRRVRLEFPFRRDHDGFEEVMLYYHLDALQRRIQSLGFTNIYNRPIRAFANSEPPGIPYGDAQAYFLPSDAQPGTGELAFGSGGVDMAEDPDVIAHEYGHAIQENQVPGFGSSFETLETFAIGEGWADFLSGAYALDSAGGRGAVCLGEWVSAGSPELFEGGCVRRLDSPKRYPDDLEGEPHADGEMWSAALWEILLELGQEDALRLVLQSHFFLEQDADYADAVGAVLAADRQHFGGAHEDILGRIFTARGLIAAPLPLTWFHVAKQSPSLPLPSDGSLRSAKLRLERAGTVPFPGEGQGSPLEVYVNLAHPSPGDMELVLRTPHGTERVLSRPGRLLPARPMVFGLTVESEQSLDALGGEPVAGVWTLRMRNDSFDDGSLAEWGLRFRGFVRGDLSASGALEVTDAILLLRYLFMAEDVACPEAGDYDDDGSLSVTDAIRLLLFIAGLGEAPAEPYPEPGEDLTPDSLRCGGGP